MKGTPGAAAIVRAHRDEIEAQLAEGWTRRQVWEQLVEVGGFGGSLESFKSTLARERRRDPNWPPALDLPSPAETEAKRARADILAVVIAESIQNGQVNRAGLMAAVHEFCHGDPAVLALFDDYPPPDPLDAIDLFGGL